MHVPVYNINKVFVNFVTWCSSTSDVQVSSDAPGSTLTENLLQRVLSLFRCLRAQLKRLFRLTYSTFLVP